MYTSHKQELIKGVYADILGGYPCAPVVKKAKISGFSPIFPDLAAYIDLFSIVFGLNYVQTLNLAGAAPR